MKRTIVVTALVGLFLAPFASAETRKPNVLIIFVDDMGYGEVSAYNPERCKVPTPHIDKLASQGMRFTDAHSSSSVCTPSRYSLLTGRYAWRTRLQSGVIAHGAPLIANDRMTLATMFKAQGYQTAGFGKWHLGFQYEKAGNAGLSPRGKPLIPIGAKLTEGPVTRGFDSYYWMKLFKEYWTMIEDETAVGDIPHEAFLPSLVERGKAYIKEQAKSDQPFFAYWAPCVPHTPIAPSAPWQGKSKVLNAYGDFILELDDAVGQLMAELKATGQDKNTIVLFSSDNGHAPLKEVRLDSAEAGHFPSAHWRGFKAGIWEGGHRVPLIVRWPGHIKAGAVTDQQTCLTDLMATYADLLGVELPDNAAEDSISLLPTLLRGEGIGRNATVHHSMNGYFAIRKGKWKLILAHGSGRLRNNPFIEQLEKKKGAPPRQLYDLSVDPGEQNNLQAKHPEIVKELTALLERYVAEGRSTEGAPQKNDVPVIIDKTRVEQEVKKKK